MQGPTVYAMCCCNLSNDITSKKNESFVANRYRHKTPPLYLSTSSPATESNCISLALLSTELAYLARLFIFSTAVCVNRKINNIAERANFSNNDNTCVKLFLHDGRKYDEYNGGGFVEIQIFLSCRISISLEQNHLSVITCNLR